MVKDIDDALYMIIKPHRLIAGPVTDISIIIGFVFWYTGEKCKVCELDIMKHILMN